MKIQPNPPPFTRGINPDGEEVLFPTPPPIQQPSGGGIAHRLFKRLQNRLRRLEAQSGCTPFLSPDAKFAFIGSPTDPTYGEFIFDTLEASETFSFRAWNVDPLATFAIVPDVGPAPTFNSTPVITPGTDPAFDEIDVDLDTSGMAEPGSAFIVITNPNGCSAAIHVQINAPN